MLLCTRVIPLNTLPYFCKSNVVAIGPPDIEVHYPSLARGLSEVAIAVNLSQGYTTIMIKTRQLMMEVFSNAKCVPRNSFHTSCNKNMSASRKEKVEIIKFYLWNNYFPSTLFMTCISYHFYDEKNGFDRRSSIGTSQQKLDWYSITHDHTKYFSSNLQPR